MNTQRVVNRSVPKDEVRPSIALKWNPSELTRRIMPRIDRLRGREPERYPEGYKDSIRAPWPQPSPWDAEGLPPAVLHVPPHEVYEFLGKIASRAARTLWTGSPAALKFSLSGEGLEPMSDAEFAERCTTTTFAWFLHRGLTETDRDVFREILATLPSEAELYRIEGSAMDGVETLPGIYVAGTVALFVKRGGQFIPVAIRVGARVYRPSEPDAWELMKYYVLQGCAVQLLFVRHPQTHFPYDAIAAITGTVLPRTHRLRRLLEPHFGFQLAQNFAALYVSRSVGHNNQHEIYTPFPNTRRGFFQMMRRGYSGIPGNPAYPAWSFRAGCPQVEHTFGRYLQAYYDVFAPFVDEALHGLTPDDPHVARWADSCAQWVRGFPDAARMRAEGSLAAVVATIMHNVSVVHTADHDSLFAQPIRKVSMRVRTPPPENPATFRLDRRKLVTREDVFRYHLGRQMYFQAHVVTPLIETDYALDESVAPDATARFRAGLREVASRSEWSHLAPLEVIASSIQF